jgi:hypothetical protein
MYLSPLLFLLVVLAAPALGESGGQELTDLESACYGWSGPEAYRQAQESGACAQLGMESGERSAFDAPPEYPQFKKEGK